jgi:SAM-dependent methyltransferase
MRTTITKYALNPFIDTFLHFFSEDDLLSFYSKHSGSHKRPIRAHISQRIFYEHINRKIKKDQHNIERFRGLLFRDNSSLEWCESKKKDLYDYYMGNGNSCLPYVISDIESNKKKPKILDIGCGSGNCIELIGIQNVDGVDFSENAIEAARKRFPNSKFWCIDALEWARIQPSFRNWKYDIGYSHYTLQLFPMNYVAELYKLLHDKKICKRIYVSDSCLQNVVGDSIYNPDKYGYIRFDHDHAHLMNQAGYSGRIFADFRTSKSTELVVWLAEPEG